MSIVVGLTSCSSNKAEQIQQLQQTKKTLDSQASENLANIDNLRTKIVKYRSQADVLQKKSDHLDLDITNLKQAYNKFKDPNNDSAIAVSKELTQKTLQKVRVDEKVNNYRSQANVYQAQINDLKATSQTQANQASLISQKINQLQTQNK